MSTLLFKPENALKRAEELIVVGQPALALQSLHDFILSKRFRSPLVNTEGIMMKYVDLIVDLRKSKMAKEALTQYRNIIQYSSTSSLENVLRHFVDLAESRLAKAPMSGPCVDDVECPIFYEMDIIDPGCSLIERILSGEETKDRTGSDTSVEPFRFLWEVYRVCLDTIRNNYKMEEVYRMIAERALSFCKVYSKKAEFRRLCEIIRGHLSLILKTATSGSSQPNAISPFNKDSLGVLLRVRFFQLNTAMSLELWSDSYKTIEDIHELLCIARTCIDPLMMINYYEALAKIFQVSGNALFHAAAWHKYLSFAGSLSGHALSEEKLEIMTSCALLSALSVPIHSRPSYLRDIFTETTTTSGPVDAQIFKDSKITALMGLAKIPTRDQLLSDATVKHYWSYIHENVKQLFELMEVDVSKDASEFVEEGCCVFSFLGCRDEFVSFVPALRRLYFFRLLDLVGSSVMQINFDDVLGYAGRIFDSVGVTLFDIELFILNEFSSPTYSILIDYKTRSIYFRAKLAFPVMIKENLIEPNASVVVDSKLPIINSQLNEAMMSLLMRKDYSGIHQELVSVCDLIGFETGLLPVRKRLVEKHRLAQEQMMKARQTKIMEAQIAQAKKDMEMERERRAEDVKKKEIERVRLELQKIQLEEKTKLAHDVNRKLGVYGKCVNVEELISLDRSEILRRQSEELESAKKEFEKKLSGISRRTDHLERAYRLEERPLLAKDYEEQIRQEEIAYGSQSELKQIQAKQRHLLLESTIRSCKRVLEESRGFFEGFSGRQKEIAGEKRMVASKMLEEAKQKRRAEVLSELRLSRENRIREEERMVEERRWEEEMERKRAENFEIQQRLDMQARIQVERDREVEEKRAGLFRPRTTPRPGVASAESGDMAVSGVSRWRGNKK